MLLDKNQKLGCQKSIQLHFLDALLNFFSENPRHFSGEEEKDFNKKLKLWKKDTKLVVEKKRNTYENYS